MQMKIFVGNLSFNTQQHQIEELFAGLGEVTSVSLVTDRETGRSRGFAFVEMANSTEGQAACQALNERELDGRRLTVNEARPQERRSGGGGGGGFSKGPRRESRW
jgi:cold-inducible RNA-binding protein